MPRNPFARTKDGETPPAEKKQGRLSQILDVYRVSKETDPVIGWWMLLAFLGTFALLLLVGILLSMPWIFGSFGVLFGILAATIVMSRRAERAAYARDRRAGRAVGAALVSIRRGWYTDREPVAADVARPGDIRSAAMVYRALGRPGVVLVGEGPTGRVQKLLAAEKKRVERVAPGVPVTTMRVGNGEGEVPLPKLASKVQRLKPRSPRTRWPSSTSASSRSVACASPAAAGCRPDKARMDRKALRGK